jgi:uncharacterized membrane protein
VVLMAIDHARDLWAGAAFDPTDPTRTTLAHFATRWITHLCAPAFMLLAGVGAYLSLDRGVSRAGLSRFLAVRGLLLIVLELTVVNLCWQGVHYEPMRVRALVLWALGFSMLALAPLARLPLRALLGFGVALCIGHNLLDGVKAASLGPVAGLAWKVAHEMGRVGTPGKGQWAFVVLYPLIPWAGVMALGFVLGAWMTGRFGASPPDASSAAKGSGPNTPDMQQGLRPDLSRLALKWGLLLLGSFAVVRGLNLYGDPARWTHHDSPLRTALSFLAVTKYPPSLSFLLVTGGLFFIILALFARGRVPGTAVLSVFGRAPFFFYVAHLALLSFPASVVYFLRLGDWPRRWAMDPSWGFGLFGTYVAWAVTVALLYPACRWYAGLRERHPTSWLRYF